MLTSDDDRKGLPEPLGPTSWGLSRRFVASLGRTALFDLVPDRVDPRDWMTAELAPIDWTPHLLASPPAASGCEEGCEDLWFDYVADTGDSQRGTYSVAYLLHGDLYAQPAAIPSAVTTEPASGTTKLPMGAFLLMGGDLAYVVADDKTLRERLVAPFDRAYERRGVSAPPRPLFAVPGNHDWYDSLDGFNRLLRVPAPGTAHAAITLKGFRPVQGASYAAVPLPFDWSLWVVDARAGADVDKRQQAYFAKHRPRNLILATPAPLVVWDELRGSALRLLEALGLKLHPAQGNGRVYLSGDSHHYARHELPPEGDSGGAADGATTGATNIVCGLGGASLHPPRSDRGTYPAARLFPTVAESRRSVLGRLLSPLHMLFRSGFAAFGALMGALLGAGVAAFEGEPSILLRHLGVMRFGHAPTPPRLDWWPRTLVAALVLTVVVPVFFRKVLRPLVARDEAHARKRSVFQRGLLAALVLGGGFALAVAASALGAGRSALSAAFDLLVYVVLLVGSVGLGPITLGLSAGRVRGLRKVAIVLVGSGVGVAVVTLAALLLTRALDALAPLAVVTELLAAARPPGVSGTAAYLILQIVGAGVGGLFGAVIFSVMFGWHIGLQYALGNQNTFAGSLATVDRYQAFIRFRLRRHADLTTELTGFVIGVDEPVSDRVLRGGEGPAMPRAKLVDVFSVAGTAKPGGT
jgi:hypothetical protein